LGPRHVFGVGKAIGILDLVSRLVAMSTSVHVIDYPQMDCVQFMWPL